MRHFTKDRWLPSGIGCGYIYIFYALFIYIYNIPCSPTAEVHWLEGLVFSLSQFPQLVSLARGTLLLLLLVRGIWASKIEFDNQAELAMALIAMITVMKTMSARTTSTT